MPNEGACFQCLRFYAPAFWGFSFVWLNLLEPSCAKETPTEGGGGGGGGERISDRRVDILVLILTCAFTVLVLISICVCEMI